jgi:hypothetical protein
MRYWIREQFYEPFSKTRAMIDDIIVNNEKDAQYWSDRSMALDAASSARSAVSSPLVVAATLVAIVTDILMGHIFSQEPVVRA